MLGALLTVASLQAPVPLIRPSADPSFHQDPALELTHLRGLLRAPNSNLLVVDDGSTIERLDSTGRRLGLLSRTGSGPGEVRSVVAFGFSGDSLWVADAALRRLTFFSGDLRLLRSQLDQERCGKVPWALVPNGRCVVFDQPYLSPQDPDPPGLPLVLTSRHGPTDTLGLISNVVFRVRYADAVAYLAQPFADAPHPVYSRDGTHFAWVGRKPSGRDAPPQVQVDWIDLATGARHIFAFAYTPQPLTQDSISHFLRTMTTGPERLPGLYDSLRHRLYRPPLLPPTAGELFDDSGNLWLAEQPPSGDAETRWRVFDAAGQEHARVLLPRTLHLLLVSGPRLIGSTLDADDVPHLTQLRLPAPVPR